MPKQGLQNGFQAQGPIPLKSSGLSKAAEPTPWWAGMDYCLQSLEHAHAEKGPLSCALIALRPIRLSSWWTRQQHQSHSIESMCILHCKYLCSFPPLRLPSGWALIQQKGSRLLFPGLLVSVCVAEEAFLGGPKGTLCPPGPFYKPTLLLPTHLSQGCAADLQTGGLGQTCI